jgi:hypothetical protein
MRRRRHGGHDNPDLPTWQPPKGQIVGAILLGVETRDEGIIARGALAERWRLTDDINALLAPDHEFVVGATLDEVRVTLESRYLSPVAGVSLIEVCGEGDLKRHSLPFADPALYTLKANHPQYNWRSWEDNHTRYWVDDVVGVLTRLCGDGGTDLLISAVAEAHIRDEDDFDGSDLVIGRRDSWYSVVKYLPAKAAARRKTRGTIVAKEGHVADLARQAADLRVAAGKAYNALRGELEKFGVGEILVRGQVTSSHYEVRDSGDGSMASVCYLLALKPIHAALLGKRAYRRNAEWQAFLAAVRDRPADLKDDAWGCGGAAREWIMAECLIRVPKPTRKMLLDRAAAEAAELRARTCASCGNVEEDPRDLSGPPAGSQVEYADGAKLCTLCWEAEFDVVAGAEQPEESAVAT